jgi:hypothetical protein
VPSEKSILNDVLMTISALPGTLITRQNTGQAWQGDVVRAEAGEYIRVEPGMKILRNARPITFGTPGLGDSGGVRKGKAFQIETKTLHGEQAEQQRKFQKAWENVGGVYILARSPASAKEQLLTLIP